MDAKLGLHYPTHLDWSPIFFLQLFLHVKGKGGSVAQWLVAFARNETLSTFDT